MIRCASHQMAAARLTDRKAPPFRRVPTPQGWGNRPEQVTGECSKFDPWQSRMSP